MLNGNNRHFLQPAVSVIVPVYNTEVYLEQCFDSLRAQTLKEIEIIVIDDGSTDNSGSICDCYSIKDRRFTVIHKKHEGLAAARNEGIEKAKADYIMFVDSDDWVEPEFCEEPFCVAEASGAELVLFQSKKHGNMGKKHVKSFQREGIAAKADVLTKLWLLTGESPWNKMYHRKLFDEIRYPVGRLCEDSAVTYRLVYKANTIVLLNKCLYHYHRYRPGSISSNRSVELMQDYFSFEFKRIDDLKRWGYDYMHEQARIAVSYLAIIGRNMELSERCDKILREYNHFKESSLFFRHKFMIHMYRISPRIFDIVSILTRKRI